MTATGGATSNLGSVIGGMVPGGQAPGTVVGQETPQWDLPNGPDSLPADVRDAFMRSDAGPSGLNEFLQQMLQSNPGLIDRFRAMVNAGVLKPKNAAAQNMVTGYGGYRAGDMTPLGPLINGMPSGLNESQLNTFANILNTGTQYNLGLLDQMGYFDGMPTLEREQVMGQLAQGWMQQATEQFLATETQRSNMATEGLTQQEITNQNIQQMASIFGGQTVTDPATGQTSFQPTEEAREFNTEQSGYLDGNATLTREQQAFNQAKDVANLASNPRNYIEAQMLGNARGGLGGMEPNNQVQQTTFGPATTTQMPQFNAPGGQFNQMPGAGTMMGTEGPGSQAGPGMAMPNAQQQAQGPVAPGQYNLANPDVWNQMGNQAGQQWGTAQQGLATMQGNAGFQGLMPQGNTPPGPGPGQPPWPGVPSSQLGTREPMMYVGGGPDASGRRFDENTGQYTYAPMPTAAENYQKRMDLFRQQGSLPQAPGAEGQAGQAGVGFQTPTPGQPQEQMNDIWMGMPMDQRPPQQPRWGGQLPGGQVDAWMGMKPTPQQPRGGQQPGMNYAMDGATLQREGPESLGQMRAGGQSPAQQLMAQRAAAQGGQNVAAANQGAKVPVSAFTSALMQNRVTPRSGAIQGSGQMMTAQGIRSGFNPNKIRTQDYLKGNTSERAMTNAVGSMAGYSDEDLGDIMKNNLPSFKAPGAGRMV